MEGTIKFPIVFCEQVVSEWSVTSFTEVTRVTLVDIIPFVTAIWKTTPSSELGERHFFDEHMYVTNKMCKCLLAWFFRYKELEVIKNTTFLHAMEGVRGCERYGRDTT